MSNDKVEATFHPDPPPLRTFRCPFCDGDKFARFFMTINDVDIKNMSTEDFEKSVRQMRKKNTEPHVTLSCLTCHLPVRLAPEDKVQAVSFFMKE